MNNIRINSAVRGKVWPRQLHGLHTMDEDLESKESIFIADSELDIPQLNEIRPADEETILLNVGGQIFETYISTLNRLSCRCRLADELFLRAHFRPAHSDFFFDRDPDAFKCVLNLLRTGQLHVPTHICGPSLKTELKYWGVDDGEIERCCWGFYNSWDAQSKALSQLERNINGASVMHCVNEATASRWQRFKANVWNFLDNPSSSRAAKAYTWFSIFVVIISIFTFCAETHPTFQVSKKDDIWADYYLSDKELLETKQVEDSTVSEKVEGAPLRSTGNITNNEVHSKGMVPHPALMIIDFMCLFFFTLEFLLRVCSSPAKISFMLSPLNIIDFVAILPDYVELVLMSFSSEGTNEGSFVAFIFILRIVRIFRILRLIRHVPGLWILLFTVSASFNELLLMALFLIIGMVVFSSLIFYAEAHTQTDFTNIPIGFWWSLVTMTTVGYGDMVPKTGLGYIVGSLCALVGLLMLAFTVPIIVGNFVLYYTHIRFIINKKNKMMAKSEETLRDSDKK